MTPDYIYNQVKKYDRFKLAGNERAADDCLFRIGSHLDLLQPGEQVTDKTRPMLVSWIERNADVFAPIDATGYEILASLSE